MKEITECTHFLSKNQKTFDKGCESTVLQNEKRGEEMHSFPLDVKTCGSTLQNEKQQSERGNVLISV